MTPLQTQRAQVALSVLQSFPRHEKIYEGAMAYFGQHRDLGADQPFCLDEPLKRQITQATLDSKVWEYGLPGIVRLQLARQLGPRDRTIIKDVGSAAFSTGPIEDIAFSDVRPMARSVLAAYGEQATPWRDEALRQMNAKDSLGTSAAQVAAASGDPAAVAAVARLLRQSLSETPRGAIPRDRAQRLVELAYAIGAAGPAGRPHVGLLSDFVARDIESFAPPFGIIERPPSEVCRAVEMVGGPEAEKVLNSPRCARPWFRGPG